MTCNQQCTDDSCCIPYQKASDIHHEIMRDEDCDLYMILCIITAVIALCFMCFTWGAERERDYIYKACNSTTVFTIRKEPGYYACARINFARE
jgi:hypothetical protein